MISKEETDRFRAVPQLQRNAALRDIADQIHRATMNGTTDHVIVKDAIERLKLLAEDRPADKAAAPARVPTNPFRTAIATPKPLGTFVPYKPAPPLAPR